MEVSEAPSPARDQHGSNTAGQVRSLQTNLTRVEDQLQRALVREKQLREALEAAQSNSSQRAQIDFLKRENDSLIEKLSLASPRVDTETSRRLLQDRINVLEIANQTLHKQRSDTQAALEEMRSSAMRYEKTLADLTQKLEIALDELEKEERKSDNLQNQVQNLIAQLEAGRQMGEAERTVISELERKNSDLSERLQASLSSMQSGFRDEQLALQRRLSEAQEECIRRDRALSAREEEWAATSGLTEKKVRDLEATLAGLRAESERNKELNAQLNSSLDEHARYLAEVTEMWQATARENEAVREREKRCADEFNTLTWSLQSSVLEISARDRRWEEEARASQARLAECELEAQVPRCSPPPAIPNAPSPPPDTALPLANRPSPSWTPAAKYRQRVPGRSLSNFETAAMSIRGRLPLAVYFSRTRPLEIHRCPPPCRNLPRADACSPGVGVGCGDGGGGGGGPVCRSCRRG
jgi:chromosome segregation ATPase